MNKVVDMKGKPRRAEQSPVPHFWFAQVDMRLGRIEFMITRLEWQMWLVFCGLAGVLILEIIKTLSGRPL